MGIRDTALSVQSIHSPLFISVSRSHLYYLISP
nr:MAG TPA: hypothetical protein [Caudoviricetes sp.]